MRHGEVARASLYVPGQRTAGGSTSGDALNLFLWRMDQLISSMAGSRGVRYSRVADDFVLSSKHPGVADELVAKLEEELGKRGVGINTRKKSKHGYQNCSKDRRVHSISVSKPRGTAISSDQSKTARDIATNYVRACKSVSADSIEAVAAKRQSLFGWINYCRQAEFGPARELRRYLEAGDRHIAKRLRSLAISSPKNKWWVVNFKLNRNEPRRIASIWRKRDHPPVSATARDAELVLGERSQ